MITTSTIQNKTLPFIEYINSDKSIYPHSKNIIDKRTGRNWIDKDDDFLIGNSGGFLLNWNFKFIDTHFFSNAARVYNENKNNPDIVNWVNSLTISKSENRDKYYYCPYRNGTEEYNDFWRVETYRRRNGITAKCKLTRTGEIVDLHITGDHYNYLNYSRINRTPTQEEFDILHKKGDYKTKLISGFPRFWDGDYWNFKIDFFIAENGWHLTKGKARGKGYSFKRGSQAANTLNLIPNSTVVLAADLIDYLTDSDATSGMVKTNLDWLENHTHWKRFYLSENLEELELGYKTSTGGNTKYGFRSKLYSVSLHNNESAAIGKRAIEIDFEEAGRCPNLEKALGVTLSSTEVGASNIGTIRVYGTAGTKSANWAPFANVFFNPRKNKMMEFENVWDYNARNKVCGFFHPQVLNMEPYMDKYGNSQLEAAYKYDKEDKKIQEHELSVSEYIIYAGQRANTPEEAFRQGGENIFSSIELSNHAARVLSDESLSYYRDGMLIVDDNSNLVFKTNIELKELNIKTHPYITDVPFNEVDDLYGCIREYFPPFKIDGNIPDNLYYVTYDTVGINKKAKDIISKNSLNSMQVLMYPNNYTNINGNMIVATYAGRPELMEDADKIFLNLCKRYNAKHNGIVETDRGETVTNFKKWKETKWLASDPTVILSNKVQESINDIRFGISIGAGDNAIRGLKLLRDWLYTRLGDDENGNPIYIFHYINDIPFLRELLSFTFEGNFDRISSMRVGMFLLNAMKVKLKSDMINASKHHSASIYEQINLYGYKS